MAAPFTASPVRLLLAGLLLWPLVPARADTYVVVNSANPVQSLSPKQAQDLFMGRNRSFPNQHYAVAFDLPRDHPARAAFYRSLTGMDMAELTGYWARLMFAGQTLPPQPLPSEAVMVEVLKHNAGGIGYLGRDPADKDLRVVLVLK